MDKRRNNQGATAVKVMLALIAILTALYIWHDYSRETSRDDMPAIADSLRQAGGATGARAAAGSDNDDWAAAVAAGTTEGYLDYLSSHPRGHHANEARDRVEQLAVARAAMPDSAFKNIKNVNDSTKKGAQ